MASLVIKDVASVSFGPASGTVFPAMGCTPSASCNLSLSSDATEVGRFVEVEGSFSLFARRAANGFANRSPLIMICLRGSGVSFVAEEVSSLNCSYVRVIGACPSVVNVCSPFASSVWSRFEPQFPYL